MQLLDAYANLDAYAFAVQGLPQFLHTTLVSSE